jgi:hypothetical protein
LSKYSRFKYSQATYGATPAKLAYTINPFSAVVLDHTADSGLVRLDWTLPTGTFSQMRIVRNQDVFPETPEDGVIVFDKYNDPAIGDISFEDSVNNSYPRFVTGRFAYYRAWLKKSDHVWYPAGDIYVLIPTEHSSKTSRETTRTGIEDHDPSEGVTSEAREYSSLDLLSTHDKMVDLLPRVFTSASQSPLDAVDKESFLYRFLGALALSFDETTTYADLLKPQHSGRSSNPAILQLQANQLGLTLEPFIATKSQKRMIREARYMYSRKGTRTALETMVESLTGYAPTITLSNNILLTDQDSSFTEGVGFWTASNDATVEADNTTAVPVTEALAVDLYWTGKVDVAAPGAYISNGDINIFTRGTPVTPDFDYVFSYYVKGVGGVVPSITWFDQFGAAISTDVGTGITSTTTWAKDDTMAATAPTEAVFASFKITFDSVGIFNVDMVQCGPVAATSYEEARAVNVFLDPNKLNLVKNPSFENWAGTDFVDWTTDGTIDQVATTLVGAYGESYMAELTTNVGTTELYTESVSEAILPNSFFTFSAYFNAPSGDEVLTMSLTVDDGFNPTQTITSAPFTASSEWTRNKVTIHLPNEIDFTTAAIRGTISGTTTGNVVNIDDAQIESSYSPTDYFDGSLGVFNGAVWSGDAHASISALYPNRVTKIPRLVSEIRNYLPMFTPYTISTYSGLEFKGIS